MAEHMLDMGQDTTLGKVEIAPEVIEVIAGIAAAEGRRRSGNAW